MRRIRPSLFALVGGFLTALAPASSHAVDTWTDPFPGVRRLLRTTNEPNRIHALVVDLCAPGVDIRATKTGERRKTPAAFGQAVGAEAAVNGDFFNLTTFKPSGLAIGAAERWTDTADNSTQGFIAFGLGQNHISLPARSIANVPPWMEEVVGGRPQVVVDGVLGTNSTALCTGRNPRTSAGFSEDGSTLIIAVVDGRSAASRGMTCGELGALMLDLGAHNALNLDGGGSSSMWIRGAGTVNAPSDGTPRVTANHLSVFADGVGAPFYCPSNGVAEAIEQSDTWNRAFTDIDGDGRPEACGRSPEGVQCYAVGLGELTPMPGPTLADTSGWADRSNYATIRFGDLNGDGLADVCARANAGIRCWRGSPAGFEATPLAGPDLSDAVGWAAPEYYSTIQLADFTGDGSEDLCVRTASDVRCYPSIVDGFDEPIMGPALTAADGWNDPSRFGTLRWGDLDGDGTVDLCARDVDGIKCWRNEGGAFGPPIDGPPWSDAAGWAAPQYWTTLRMADVDGDGRDELCGRGPDVFSCWDFDGAAAVQRSEVPLGDDTGWDDVSNYSTVRLADIDGDGMADLCARANQGMRCWRSMGGAFDAPIDGPAWGDADGWSAPSQFRTIELTDIDADGRADLCGRTTTSFECWLSDGAGFPTRIDGPAWSDVAGWGGSPYYSTIRVGGRVARPIVPPNSDMGFVDAGVPDPASTPDSGTQDAMTTPSDAADAPAQVHNATGTAGCGCASADGVAGDGAVFLLALLSWRRRRRRRTRHGEPT